MRVDGQDVGEERQQQERQFSTLGEKMIHIMLEGVAFIMRKKLEKYLME